MAHHGVKSPLLAELDIKKKMIVTYNVTVLTNDRSTARYLVSEERPWTHCLQVRPFKNFKTLLNAIFHVKYKIKLHKK